MSDIDWIPLTALNEAPAPGEMLAIRVGGRSIALCNHAGRFYAIDNECPHRGVPFVGIGLLEEDGLVTCGQHGWRFDLRNGLMDGDHEPCVATHAVRQVGDRLEIALAATKSDESR